MENKKKRLNPSAAQRAVLDEVAPALTGLLPIERLIFYEPNDAGVDRDASTLHIAVITDYYPNQEQYKTAFDALSALAAKHNVSILPVFSTCLDWHEYFPLVAAFDEIRRQGFEVWRRG